VLEALLAWALLDRYGWRLVLLVSSVPQGRAVAHTWVTQPSWRLNGCGPNSPADGCLSRPPSRGAGGNPSFSGTRLQGGQWTPSFRVKGDNQVATLAFWKLQGMLVHRAECRKACVRVLLRPVEQHRGCVGQVKFLDWGGSGPLADSRLWSTGRQ